MEVGKEYKGPFGLKYACVWRDETDDTFALLCVDRRGGDFFGEVFWVWCDGSLLGIACIYGQVVPWAEQVVEGSDV